MKGALAFSFGIVGLCFFAAVAALIPSFLPPQPVGWTLFLSAIGVAFVSFNLLVISFYRMLGHLHDTVVFPDDPRHFPQRGRGLFLTGYIGLVLTLALTLVAFVLVAALRIRLGGPPERILPFLACFAGCAFIGVFLAGVAVMLNDIYHKAFFRGTVDQHEDEPTEPMDISLRGRRRGREES